MSRYSPRARLTNTISTAAVANWFGNQFVTVPGSFESIATVNVGSGGASDIVFSSIPSTYAHLQIRGIMRDSSTSLNYANTFIQFNSDTGNNYAGHYLLGTGASALAFAWTSGPYIQSSYCTSSTALTNNFAAYVIDILDYANTNKTTTVRILNGFDNNNNGSTDASKGIANAASGLWTSTNAVSSIKIYSPVTPLAQYSSFALYGIKGA